MNDRLVTWAPLALLFLLAALTWWLDSKVQPPEWRSDGSTRHDPDMYVEGYSAARMNADGSRRYELKGKRLVHYPDDNSTELHAPQLIYYDPGQAPVTVKADVAQIARGGDDLYFLGNVQVVRAAYADKPELGVLTTYLHVMPEKQLARTDQPVTLIEGNSTASSVGLEFDNRTRLLKLSSQVRARYETPRSLKLGPPRR
ncbi:MAG TPA: LPS export ABC transporter periplasmic protein LptC [Burkholderiales bacterium]|jgi:lipopolysaccharide export system protein LptC|nr:LPS export ABC transporter periplasmic protein LptC [Burkholderiales bacterium]